jgi:fragile X mental retardation protein
MEQFSYNFHLLTFSWQPETKFLFSRSRLPPKEVKGPSTFIENQEIEVYSKANDQEAFGWWKALIKVNFLVTP